MTKENNKRALCSTSENNINAILAPYSWTSNCGEAYDQSYTFSISQLGTSDRRDVSDLLGINPLTLEEETSARIAMNRWEEVCGINFEEDTASTQPNSIFATAIIPENRVGITKIALENDPSLEKYADPIIKSGFTQAELTPGGLGFAEAILHEEGHSFGLAHPFYSPEFPNKPILPSSQNHTDFTVMAYNPGRYTPGFNPNSGQYDLYPATPMIYDIAAAQHLYGRNMTHNSGDTTYSFDTTTSKITIDDSRITGTRQLPGKVVTLWDAGGEDTIDLSNLNTQVRIDLREGLDPESIKLDSTNKYSPYVTAFADYRIFLAYGVDIEKAITGPAHDIVYLGNNRNSDDNEGGEAITNEGNDIIHGGEKDDRASILFLSSALVTL